MAPVGMDGETMADPHIADMDCECGPRRTEDGIIVHNGEDEPVRVQ